MYNVNSWNEFVHAYVYPELIDYATRISVEKKTTKRNISAVTIGLAGNLRYSFSSKHDLTRGAIARALDGPQANRLERANQTATEEAKGKAERDDGRKQCHGRSKIFSYKFYASRSSSATWARGFARRWIKDIKILS